MSTPQLIIDLINDTNHAQYKFKSTDVTLQTPQLDITTTRNSAVQVDAVPGSGFKGSVTVYYSRASLGNVGLPTQSMSEVSYTAQSVLDLLNQNLLIKIDQTTDLQPFTVPALNVGDILTLDLTAQDGSYAWIGSTEIALLFGLPPNVGDVSTIMNVTLPSGF